MGLFLLGVLAASLMQGVAAGFLIVVCLTAISALLLFILERRLLALFCITVIFGFAYFQWYGARQQERFTAPIGSSLELTGLVEKVITKDSSQSVDIQLRGDYSGLIRANVRLYPAVRYGDVVRFSGVLQSTIGPSAEYFAKEGIGAVMKFPKELAVIAHDKGSRVKAGLLAIRSYVEESFTKTLAPEQATLMTGLVLGKSGGFSKEFTEKLKATGTTHLVALSGFNISVIVTSLLWFSGFIINRCYGVWVCVAVIVGFVVMTGAEASVVRAAVMATIMILAEQSSRMYSVRNAIVAAAFVMVLSNPAILVFDVGFQLSFLALMGIVYLQPAIEKFFKINPEPGILEWRKNAVASTAAQLAVLPIILTSFGFFSPLSIITNVLLLSFIPYTMALGFFIAFARLFSPYLAFVLALPAKLLLGYELAVIDFFAKLPLGFQIERLPIGVSILYYGLLIAFVAYIHRRQKYAASI